MPPPMLWRSRGPLYKFALVVLLAITPFNMLSVVLPFWLEVEGQVALGDPGEAISRKEHLHYGLWELCSDSLGCSWVHDVSTDAGVGVWLYFVEFFMTISLLLHVLAALCGALQNLLSRDVTRRWTSSFWKKVVHRDCALAEDVGFVAGFFGQVATIIFMLCTKDKVSDGATYSWSFAIGFMATSMAVLSSVTLTKAHTIAAPRPNVRSRSRPQPEPGRELAESATPWDTGEPPPGREPEVSESRLRQGEDESRLRQGESETRLRQGEDESRLRQGESDSRRQGQSECESPREQSDSSFRRLQGEHAARWVPGSAVFRRGHRDSAPRTWQGKPESRAQQGQSAPHRGHRGEAAYRREQGDDPPWRDARGDAHLGEQRDDDATARGEEYSAYWREQASEARPREGEAGHRATPERTPSRGEHSTRAEDNERPKRREGRSANWREGGGPSSFARQRKSSRSRSRSRSRERRGGSKPGRQNSGSSSATAGHSRLVRSRELENIPAAVAPSSLAAAADAARAPAAVSSRQRPGMCVEMTDLQIRAPSPGRSAASSLPTGHESVPSAGTPGDSDRCGSSSSVSRPSSSGSSSRQGVPGSRVSNPKLQHRTVIDVSVKLPPRGGNNSASGDNSELPGTGDSNRGEASGELAVDTTRL